MYYETNQSCRTNRKDEMDSTRTASVASGVMLTPEYLKIMSDVVAFISDAVGRSLEAERAPRPAGVIRRLLAGLSHRAPAAQPPAASPVLGPEHLRQAYQLALAKARQLGMSEEQARCLADAVMGPLE